VNELHEFPGVVVGDDGEEIPGRRKRYFEKMGKDLTLFPFIGITDALKDDGRRIGGTSPFRLSNKLSASPQDDMGTGLWFFQGEGDKLDGPAEFLPAENSRHLQESCSAACVVVSSGALRGRVIMGTEEEPLPAGIGSVQCSDDIAITSTLKYDRLAFHAETAITQGLFDELPFFFQEIIILATMAHAFQRAYIFLQPHAAYPCQQFPDVGRHEMVLLFAG
jgi:hypothetical protein